MCIYKRKWIFIRNGFSIFINVDLDSFPSALHCGLHTWRRYPPRWEGAIWHSCGPSGLHCVDLPRKYMLRSSCGAKKPPLYFIDYSVWEAPHHLTAWLALLPKLMHSMLAVGVIDQWSPPPALFQLAKEIWYNLQFFFLINDNLALSFDVINIWLRSLQIESPDLFVNLWTKRKKDDTTYLVLTLTFSFSYFT